MTIRTEVVGVGEIYHIVGDDGVTMYEYLDEAQAVEQLARLQEQGVTTKRKLENRIGATLIDVCEENNACVE